MNLQAIYSNPVVQNCLFLFVQVDDVQVDGQATLIRFRIAPVTQDMGGNYLYSRLAHSEKAEKL